MLGDLLDGPVEVVAPRLLGAVLSVGEVSIRLTEVEAYGGSDDPGSHAHRGRTDRNRTMFGPPGHLYCYLIYGLHVCANVVTGPPGEASAVLVRAGEVIAGHEQARQRRGNAGDRDLARGPGRLCRCLGLELSSDGVDLAQGPVLLAPALAQTAPGAADPRSTPRSVSAAVRSGPRVGLRRAADRPWRFWLSDEPSVSGYRRASVRHRP